MELFANIIEYSGIVIIAFGTICMIFYREDMVKLHFSGISDTVGISLLIVAQILKNPDSILKWVLLLILVLITGPIATMAISKGIFERTQKK